MDSFFLNIGPQTDIPTGSQFDPSSFFGNNFNGNNRNIWFSNSGTAGNVAIGENVVSQGSNIIGVNNRVNQNNIVGENNVIGENNWVNGVLIPSSRQTVTQPLAVTPTRPATTPLSLTESINFCGSSSWSLVQGGEAVQNSEFPWLGGLFGRARNVYLCTVNLVSAKHAVTGTRNNKEGPCKGDSGAGYMQWVNDRYYLRGLVSHSLSANGNCNLQEYIIFTDLSKEVDWLVGIVS